MTRGGIDRTVNAPYSIGVPLTEPEMIYLVEVAYVPKENQVRSLVQSERVDAKDPDAACVAVRDLYRTRVASKRGFQIRRVKVLPEYIVRADSSLTMFYPQNDAAREWLEDHCEEAQWLGNAMACEHRYAQDLIQFLQDDGFTVGI